MRYAFFDNVTQVSRYETLYLLSRPLFVQAYFIIMSYKKEIDDINIAIGLELSFEILQLHDQS